MDRNVMHIVSKGIRLFTVATLLAGLATALQPATSVHAATLTVTSNADGLANDSQCTLREAITNTNDNATTWADCIPAGAYGNDVITFAAATNGVPIVLAGVAGEDGNAGGDLDITDNLTINGNGAGLTVIQGGGIDRAFHIANPGITVNINNLTAENGDVTGLTWPADEGGGIHNSGSILTLTNCNVSNNQAYNGGGIFNQWGGITTVDASTVSANTAVRGGGIYNEATLIVQNGSIIGGAGAGNQATGPEGGGIFNFVGTVTVDASTVSANTCADRGGGIYNQDTLIVQNGSTIGGAGAGNQARDGGGILISVGTTTVDGSIISANTATNDGGGIFNASGLTINNSTISDNISLNADGGGIDNEAGGNAAISDSTINNNIAEGGGGGIFNGAQVALTNVTISANITNIGLGGGIANAEGGQMALLNVTLSNNQGAAGNSNIVNTGIFAITLQNTIVANSAVGNSCGGIPPFILSLGNNLDDDGSCNLAQPTDLSKKDPKLGPLQDNGGPTETHALLSGSPAINAGDDNVCPPTDQRGVSRPQGSHCDIGAYEQEKPTAITLPDSSFTAEANAGRVTLTWETATELDNAGFNLYRALLRDGPYTQVNDTLIPAQGDPVSGASYSFVDTPDYGTFYYKLEDVDYNGASTLHGPVRVTVARPLCRPLYRPTPPEF